MTGLSPENRALVNADPELSTRALGGGFSSAVSLLSIGAAAADLERLLNAARDEGRRSAYSSSVYAHISRRVAELQIEGKPVSRVELTRREIDRLTAEFEPLTLRRADIPTELGSIARLATLNGTISIVEADRAAICWRRPGRSYGTDTWERETL